jgi:hypothetical protein
MTTTTAITIITDRTGILPRHAGWIGCGKDKGRGVSRALRALQTLSGRT